MASRVEVRHLPATKLVVARIKAIQVTCAGGTPVAIARDEVVSTRVAC